MASLTLCLDVRTLRGSPYPLNRPIGFLTSSDYRFASFADHILPVWNSRFPEPGSAGTDTFTQSSSWLDTDLNFAHLHPRDLPKLVEFLRVHKARKMALVPKWRGALWFQNMCELPHNRFFVKKSLQLRDPHGKSLTSLWDFEKFLIYP